MRISLMDSTTARTRCMAGRRRRRNPGLDYDALGLLRALVRKQSVTGRVLEHLTDALACPCGALKVLLCIDLLRNSDTL